MLGFKQEANSNLLSESPVCLCLDLDPKLQCSLQFLSFVQHILLDHLFKSSKTHADDFTMEVHYSHVCLSLLPVDALGVRM